jgi:hypothetical protein
MHDLSLSIYACAVPSRRSNYLFIYLYLSLVLWECATPSCHRVPCVVFGRIVILYVFVVA